MWRSRFQDITLGVEGRNADRVHKTLLPSYWGARTHVCSKIHSLFFLFKVKHVKFKVKTNRKCKWKPKLWNLQCWVCMKITNSMYGRTFPSIHQMKAKKRTKITESCRAVPLSWRTGFASISQSGEPTWKIYKFDQVDFELQKFYGVIQPGVELITW